MKHKITGLVVFLGLRQRIDGRGSKQRVSVAGKRLGPTYRFTSTKFTARNIPNGKEATFEGNVKVNQGDGDFELRSVGLGLRREGGSQDRGRQS